MRTKIYNIDLGAVQSTWWITSTISAFSLCRFVNKSFIFSGIEVKNVAFFTMQTRVTNTQTHLQR